MALMTVLGGTGYVGSAIVAEAASRGHRVSAFGRKIPQQPLAGVQYLVGDVRDEQAVASAIEGADVVVGALSPRGDLAPTFREAYRGIAQIADRAGVSLYVVGGFSSLRPAPGQPRYAADLSASPPMLRDEQATMAALVAEDLPASPPTLDWVVISPPGKFLPFSPGTRLGHYRVGNDVAVDPEAGGGDISGVDYALGFVDLIEGGRHHREHLNLAY